MAARTLGIVAAIGLVASASAHADPPGGDIVDQILYPNGVPAAGAPPMPAAAPLVLPAPPPPSPPPQSPSAASAASPPFTVSTLDAPDIIGQPPPPVMAAPTPIAPPSLAPPPLGAFPPITPAVAVAPAAPVSPGDVVGQVQTPLPVPPPEAARWRGFYAGLDIGGGWTDGGTGDSCINSATNTTSGCIALNNGALHTEGVLGGAHFGYLAPVHLGDVTLMVGAETDVTGSGISGKQNFNPPLTLVGFGSCNNCFYQSNQSLNWFSTVRARIGVPIDNFLVYATGGLMIGGVQTAQNIFVTGQAGNYVSTTNSTLVGPTVGGGVEFLFPGAPVSARLEGLYYDLGHVRAVAQPTNGAAINFSDTRTFGFRGGIVRLGVSWLFGDFVY